MFEKRTSERSPIELAASYGIGEDPRPEREARINNISSGGLCLTMAKKMGVGEKLELAVELDTNDEVNVYAKVVWANKNDTAGTYTVGVQFIETEGPDFERFMDFYYQQV